MPEIVVQLHTDAAVSDLEEAASALGVSLQPMYPGADDPELSRKFRSEVPDQAEAEQVAASLMESDAVEAAYYKPDAELP